MTLENILLGGGGIVLVLLTLVQVAPIEINPWSAIARLLGRAINAEVLTELDALKESQAETRRVLDEHIRIDDERDADAHRLRILQFNNELLREIPHTRESFIEVLTEIDIYEDYCRAHEDYKNNRAVLAVENIKRSYNDRLQKHDFCEVSV